VREVADLAGVPTEEIAAQLLHVGDDRLIAIGLRVALAPAVQAVGGLDLHEEPVLAVARIDEIRRHPRDLHDAGV
jgi:hypothetical protein